MRATWLRWVLWCGLCGLFTSVAGAQQQPLSANARADQLRALLGDLPVVATEIIYQYPRYTVDRHNHVIIVRGTDGRVERRIRTPRKLDVGLAEFDYTDPHGNHFIVLDENDVDYLNSPGPYWLLNTTTYKLSRVPQICGSRVLPTTLQDARWVQTQPLIAGRSRELCNTATGERRLMPINGHIRGFGYFSNILSYSPDNQWVLFFAGNDTFDSKYGLMAYRGADGTLVDLGEGMNGGVRWYGNHRFTIHLTDYGSGGGYLLGDVRYEDSLQVIYESGVQRFYRAPQHAVRHVPDSGDFEWVSIEASQCFLFVLRSDGVLEKYPIGSLCDIGLPLQEDDERLYTPLISTDNSVPRTRQIVRFNPFTGERTLVMEGEIELVQSVTPDGRYAGVLLDNNGQIDTIYTHERTPVTQWWPRNPFVASSFRAAIVDLTSGAIIWEQPATQSRTEWVHAWWDVPYFDAFDGRIRLRPRFANIAFHTEMIPTPFTSFLLREMFYFYRCPTCYPTVSSRDTLLTIASSGVSASPLPNSTIWLSPEGQYGLSMALPRQKPIWTLYPIDEPTRTLLMLPVIGDGTHGGSTMTLIDPNGISHEIYADIRTDPVTGLLCISFSEWFNRDFEERLQVIFHVQLP